MLTLLSILISVIIISILSLVGILFISIRGKILNKILILLIALASGSLLGGAFFHLLPESMSLGVQRAFLLTIAGILLFFVLEKFLHWRHCHQKDCKTHPFAYLNLVGGSLHNFIDGLVVSAAYMTNLGLGISTTIAIIAHEIPQEIGDYAVLVYGGMKKKKALLYNFLTALISVLGALVGYFLFKGVSMTFLLPIAAGGFIYIATTDLIPELHKQNKTLESLLHLLFFIIGLALLFGLSFLH
jgi:zinc and cadmium transporter